MKHIARALLTLTVLFSSFAYPIAAEPEAPVQEFELRAVELLTGYIDSGASHIVGNLSSTSPLRDQPAERIELLLGPAQDSVWQIESAGDPGKVTFAAEYSSGLDDLVTLELVEENGEWNLHDITNLSLTPDLSGKSASVADVPSTPSAGTLNPMLFLIGSLALALFAGVGALMVRSTARVALLVVVALSIVTAGGAVLYGFVLSNRSDDAQEVSSGAAFDLKALKEFRWSLENGARIDLEKHAALIDASRAAALWSAQSLQLDRREAEAETLLARFDAAAADPLLHIVRARLASALDRSSGAILEYEKALEQLPSSDALRLETAQSCLVQGFQDRGREHLLELETQRARHPAPYYILSIIDAIDADLEDAERRLLLAMQMEPPSRNALLSVSAAWQLLRREAVAERINLFDVMEREWESSGAPGRPLTLTGDWSGIRSGESLLLERPSAKLRLWGFAPHSPEGTSLVDPFTWERLERDRVLAAPERLAKLASDSGSWLQPSSRNRLTTAIEALDESNNWNRIDELTGALPSRLETVPTEVILARGTALQGLGRAKEAETFTAAAAVAELKRENPDAQRLYLLGELMAELERYDIAIKLLERAESLHEDADLGDRIRQLSMTQRLGSNYQLHATEHFDIRIPPETPVARARRIGTILEAELERIQDRLGVHSFDRCVVNLLSWNEFRSVYTKSNHILGFYDGAITVPLADVPVFPPEVVALLTHELTHAVVGQATSGKAPHWFQEGVAGRMEMLPGANAFNRYSDQTILPVRLLDPVLRSSPDPEMFAQGYVVSETLVRYLESFHGERVWRDLIGAFAEGLTTEEAFEKLFEKNYEEIDQSFRTWGHSRPRLFVDEKIVLYDRPDSSQWIRFSD